MSGISAWNQGWKREISINPIRDAELPGEQRDYQSWSVNSEERERRSQSCLVQGMGLERTGKMELDEVGPGRS